MIVVFGVSAALAAPALVAGSATVLAYDGCQGESSVSASTAEAVAGVSFTLSVDVRDCTGSGVQGASVVFGTQSAPQPSCQAGFSPGQAATDANGTASSQATLPAGCPCAYVLSARVPTSSGGFTLTTPVREAGCLPFTAAAAQAPTPAPSGLPWTVNVALLGVLLVLLAATGAALRRRI